MKVSLDQREKARAKQMQKTCIMKRLAKRKIRQRLIRAEMGKDVREGDSEQVGTNRDPLTLSAEQFTELTELEGTISSVNLYEGVFIDTSNDQIVLEGRSLSFAVAQGFTAQAGNDVLLEGFYEGTDFEIVQITNRTSGQVTPCENQLAVLFGQVVGAPRKICSL